MPPRNKAKSKAKPPPVQKRGQMPPQQQMRAPIAPPLDNYSAPMQQPSNPQQLQQAMMEDMKRGSR